MRQVGTELGSGSACAEIRCQVRGVPVGVELANLPGGRTFKDDDMGLGLVRDVHHDMTP